MCEKMRYVYENYNEALDIAQINKKYIIDSFSIDACAQKMKGLI
jgi:hypothetical protein